MYLQKWDPFETLSELQDDIDRSFNRYLSPNRKSKLNLAANSDWYPSVDIHEDKENYYFEVEAPGVEKDSFDVNIEDSVLTIKGERKYEVKKEEKNAHRIEREYGSFLRSFSLPETADVEKVDADYNNGVLHIKVAKKEAAKPKKITVGVKS